MTKSTNQPLKYNPKKNNQADNITNENENRI